MDFFIKSLEALGRMAVVASLAVIDPFIQDAKEAMQNAIRSTMADQMLSIDEWAQVIIDSVDKVWEDTEEKDNLQFVGGKLRFAMSKVAVSTVTISFQLYFLDESEEWRMAKAEKDLPSDVVTHDSLKELESEGEIVFPVERL